MFQQKPEEFHLRLNLKSFIKEGKQKNEISFYTLAKKPIWPIIQGTTL